MSSEYEVGYGKPPEDTRFQAGKSGNKGGRRKGSKNVKTIVRQIANEKHKISGTGKSKQYTTEEAVLLTLRNLAMSGDIRAAKLRDEVRHRLQPEPPEGAGFLVVPEEISAEDWIRRETIQNKYREPPPGYRCKSDDHDDDDEEPEGGIVH